MTYEHTSLYDMSFTFRLSHTKYGYINLKQNCYRAELNSFPVHYNYTENID